MKPGRERIQTEPMSFLWAELMAFPTLVRKCLQLLALRIIALLVCVCVCWREVWKSLLPELLSEIFLVTSFFVSFFPPFEEIILLFEMRFA